ncbi:MAG TPA: electron transfer flavoprotein subunit beta/FixA family protein [candidate division Zixibacteria bacterium]|nr:electron transfer flavoprotein subunit beta/FixA family protein [candidate division Zixibacteria bacterium]
MRFVVCIKEVPDTADVKMDPERNTLIRAGVPSIINPFDAYALELALQKKDAEPSIEIITLSMGPPQAEKSLRETIAMGADSAILITDMAFAGSDTWATSTALAAAVRKIGDVDLVFTGQQAIDGDTAQVGPGVAEFLGWPQAIFIRSIEHRGDGEFHTQRITDTGYETLSIKAPAVLSVTKLLKDPRLPSLRGMMKSKKAEIEQWSAEDLAIDPALVGLDGSPTRVIKTFPPERREGGVMLECEPEEAAKKLAEALKEMHLT